MFRKPDYFWNFMSALNCLRKKMSGAKCFYLFFSWCLCDGKIYKTGLYLSTVIFLYKGTVLLQAEPMGAQELTAGGEARKFMVKMSMLSLYGALGGNYASNSFWNGITDEQLANIYKEASEKKCSPESVAPGIWFAWR